MKKSFQLFNLLTAMVAFFFLVFTCACDKNNDDDDDNNGKMWDPGWMIGTWEGTTPSTVTPFENTKIRIVFESYNMESYDTLPGNTRKLYAYSGTFTWDVDHSPWNMGFTHANYPVPDFDVIIWDCLTFNPASSTMNNVSLRITDSIQTDPYHTINLDWGPFTDNSGNPPTSLDFYGDVQIEIGGTLFRADYPPDEGAMIRMTKK